MRILAMTLALIGTITVNGADTRPAVKIDGHAITVGQLDALIDARGGWVTPPDALQRQALRREAAEGLIDERLIHEYLKANGPKIDDKEVANTLAELVRAQKTRQMTMADFLAESGQTHEQLRDSVRHGLQMAQIVRQAAKEEVLRAYFAANRPFFDGTKVEMSHVVIRCSPDKADERAKARQQLLALRENIVAGTMTFAEAAKKYSQCPSGSKGGSVGYVARKFQIDEHLSAAAFAMKAGEVSGPIDSEVGVHLVLVTRREEGKPAKFEDVRSLALEAFGEEYRAKLLDKLRERAKVEWLLP